MVSLRTALLGIMGTAAMVLAAGAMIASAPAGRSAAVTAEFRDEPLEKVVQYLATTAGVRCEVMWKSARREGWDPAQAISLKFTDTPAMDAIERLIRTVGEEAGDSAWQAAGDGAIQLGTKDRLDAFKRIEVYDVNDLLFISPLFDDAPEIDLAQVLSGNGAPFSFGRRVRPGPRDEDLTKQQRAERLVETIVAVVEHERWADTGGSSATIRVQGGTLIVQAPEYIHRALRGGRAPR